MDAAHPGMLLTVHITVCRTFLGALLDMCLDRIQAIKVAVIILTC